MPIYEYQCRDCGAIREILIRCGNQPPDMHCTRCGSEGLERILSAPLLIRKKSDQHPGHTCCGREERCDTPPCSSQGSCRRDSA